MIELVADFHGIGDGGLEFREVGLHEVHDGERGGIGAFGDGDVDGAAAVREGVGGDEVGAILDGGDVAEEDGALRGDAERDGGEVLDVFGDGVDGDDRVFVAEVHVARRAEDIGGGHGLDEVVRGKSIRAEAVGFGVDDDGAGAAAEGRRRGDAGEGGEERADAVEGGVLHLADGDVGVVGGEDEVADGDAAGVEAGDEGAGGTGGHEGAGAVHIGDDLGHGGGHVGAGVKLEFHQGRALDGLRLYVLDAGDVEEVIFVVVGDVALHLGGVHAAEGLRNVDRGDAERGKRIARHALESERGTEADRDNENEDGPRGAQGEADEIHFFGERRAESGGRRAEGGKSREKRCEGGVTPRCGRVRVEPRRGEDEVAGDVGCQRFVRERSRERCSAGLSAGGGALCCASADS